ADIVVLRGAGDDFCVGRETMGKRPPGQQPDALELRRRNDVVFNCYGSFRRCEIPVIGMVKGRALGFGCAIAAVCDITLAADTALDMDTTGAIDDARSIHAVINTSEAMVTSAKAAQGGH